MSFMPRVNFLKVRKLFLVAFIVVLSFVGGYFLGVKGYKAEVNKALNVKISRETPPDKNADFALFWKVWDIVASRYFDKTKLIPSEMVYGSIQGMVASLGDPYTMFLPPKENKLVNEDLSGSFEGVGIEIGFKGVNLAVVSPLTGSPAEKAGVKPGDLIAHIKDVKKDIDIGTAGISLNEAVQAIRGPEGSTVTLTLIREGTPDPIVTDIVRTKLTIDSVELKFVGQNENIAYIKVNKFSSDTAQEWNKAVEGVLKNQKADRVIVDLRNNPGGYLQGAVDLASDFIQTGKVVVAEQKSDGSKNEFKVERFGKLLKYPVVVLINGGSASASEIFSGALRDQDGVKLIGTKSFGKGTIQEPIDLSGGSGLHVTTAKWLTPNGTWVHGEGLEPDVKIEDDAKTIEDEQLQKAIEAVSNL